MGEDVVTEAGSPDGPWRPWSWWGRYGWTYIVAAYFGLQIASIEAYNTTAGSAQEAAHALAWVVAALGPLALIGRALARRHTLAGLQQIAQGRSRLWPTNPRPTNPRSCYRRYHRIYVMVVFGLLLIALVVRGWEATNNQLIRHAARTQQLIADVTSTQKNCGKNGCSYDSWGDYTVNGVRQQHVRLVDASDNREEGSVTVLVNPAHPRRAVWIHDHGQGRIAEGILALIAITLGGPLLIWQLRRQSERTTNRNLPGSHRSRNQLDSGGRHALA